MEDRERWGVPEAVEYVLERGYKRVTLQFPDDLLPEAPSVARALQQELAPCSDAKVYVLADTTYNPLSVDEVAAQHVNADCVIHYGHASLTPVTRTPALCVLPRAPPLDAAECARHLAAALAEHASSSSSSSEGGGGGSDWALVTFDQSHSRDIAAVEEALAAAYQGPLRVVFAAVALVRLDPPAGSSKGGGGGGCCGGGGASGGGGAQAGPSQSCSSGGGPATGEEPRPGAGGCCAGPGASGGCGSGGGAAAATGNNGGSDEDGDGGSGGGGDNTASASGGTRGAPAPAAYVPPPLGGLTWRAPAGAAPRPRLFLWLGPPGGAALTHLQLTHPDGPWVSLDPQGGGYTATAGLSDELARLLKRRYFLVEKARGASMLGLLVGTLGASGYLEALEALRALAKRAGKKTYTLLVGKPSPAKLANFPEVEAFVMVAEPQGLVLDSRDYLAPILTPHEAHLALTGRPFEAATYRLDYGALLEAAAAAGGDDEGGEGGGSAAAGEREGEEGSGGGGGGALVASGGLQVGAQGAAGGGRVAARTAAEYLLNARGFKGLETPATGAEVKEAMAAVAGRAGRAAGYEDEPAGR